jgi:hypothetical protein
VQLDPPSHRPEDEADADWRMNRWSPPFDVVLDVDRSCIRHDSHNQQFCNLMQLQILLQYIAI